MERQQQTFIVEATYHPAESGDPAMWVGVNDELGLVVEAESLDLLVAKINEVVADLFVENFAPQTSDPSLEQGKTPAVILEAFLAGSQRDARLLSRPD